MAMRTAQQARIDASIFEQGRYLDGLRKSRAALDPTLHAKLISEVDSMVAKAKALHKRLALRKLQLRMLESGT